MNKLVIPFIIIAVITLGIGAFFVLQKPAFPEPGKQMLPQASNQPQTNKLCGDGLCDAFEKANPNLCPQDCQGQTTTTQPTSQSTTTSTKQNNQTPVVKQPLSTSKDSPFGIYSPYGEFTLDKVSFAARSDISNYLKDLGTKWIQDLPVFDFNEIPSGINIYSRVGREGGMAPDKINDQATIEKYKTALKDRILKTPNIKYYEVDTEPDGIGGWRNNPEGYAKLLKITNEAIKGECPDCKLIFGGLSGGNSYLNSQSLSFFENVLKAGGGKYFDGMEFKRHHYSAKDYSLIKNKYQSISDALAKYGIDMRKILVFVETAVYDGDPNDPQPKGNNLPVQTETEQAVGLLKTYVYGISLGADKIFWNLIYERSDYEPGHTQPFPQNPFNHYGLINNPTNNDGLSHKKLAYYTYKKMVEVLDGSNWNNIQTIQEKDGVYIYKFTKAGKPIWVAWNDNSGSKQITISGISSGSVQITQAVPKYKSGKEVTDYSTAFNTETKSVSGGKISITLGEKPVFVEEE